MRLWARSYRFGWRCANDRGESPPPSPIADSWPLTCSACAPPQPLLLPAPSSTFAGAFSPSKRIRGAAPTASVLSYDTLDWWLAHEHAISELRSSPNNYTLQDVCCARRREYPLRHTIHLGLGWGRIWNSGPTTRGPTESPSAPSAQAGGCRIPGSRSIQS